jgi:hypothetical protein
MVGCTVGHSTDSSLWNVHSARCLQTIRNSKIENLNLLRVSDAQTVCESGGSALHECMQRESSSELLSQMKGGHWTATVASIVRER